jgi:lipoprotein-releasing system permease protein
MDPLHVLKLVGLGLGYLALLFAGLAVLTTIIGVLAYGFMQVVFALLPVPEVIRFLSWRYLLKRGTNLIGVFGIFLAVGALILILSIMSGFLGEMRRSARGSLSDLILLLPPEPGSLRPRDPDEILRVIEQDPRVAGATAHLGWLCFLMDADSWMLLSDPQSSELAGVMLTGIDVATEDDATEFARSLRKVAEEPDPKPWLQVRDLDDPFASPFPSEGRPRASVILGERVMTIRRLRPGDSITLVTATPDPKLDIGWAPKEREFVVAGAFRSGENEIDLQRVYIERDQLVRFLAEKNEDEELPNDAARYSEILIKLKDYERDAEHARIDLAKELERRNLVPQGTDIATWEDFRGVLLGAVENERVLMGIMLSLILVVSGFTIFAILSMMATEKRRDVGILTSLGATPRIVLVLFLMIGFWDALIGATLGAIVGVYAALEIDPFERWLSRTFDVMIFNREIYLFDKIPTVVTPTAVALIVLGAFVCTLVFAAFPAWRAARMDPVEALRND